MKKYTNKAPQAMEKEEAPAPQKSEGRNLEAVRCIIMSNYGTEGNAVIAPGGVFEATPDQAKKLTGNGSAKPTSKPVSTPAELGQFQAAHTNGLRRMEKARLEEIRRSNS